MSLPLLDLRILKIIVSDEHHAIQFAKMYKFDLFVKPLQKFAKYVLEYINIYSSLPTKRVLVERNINDNQIEDYINAIYKKLESVEADSKEFNFDIQQIKKRYKESILFKIKNEIDNETTEGSINDPDSSLKNIELQLGSLKAIDGGETYIQKSVNEYVNTFKEELKAKRENPNMSTGILTKYSAIDYATNGFKKSDMFIVGGETAAGKSTLLSNMAIQMWMQDNTFGIPADEFMKGYNVLYFSLEMPYDQCFNRMLARLANVPQMNLTKGKLTNAEIDRVDIALSFIEEYPYHFQIIDIPRGVTAEQIELRYREASLKFQPDIVIVDYLGLMEDPKSKESSDWLKLGNIAGQLHELGRAYNVVMGTAVQLTDIKRGQNNKSRDQQVGVHRVGRSSHVMHHATFGLQIVTRPDEQSFDDMEIESIKNRNGPKIRASLGRNFANASIIDRPYNVDGSGNSINSASSIVDLTSLLNMNNSNSQIEDIDNE